MSVEIPDTLGSGDGGGDSEPRLRAVLTAIGLVVVGFLIVGVLSSQPATDSTTTLADEVTAASVLELNEPLDWQAGAIGSTWPQSLVEFEGSLYFFGSTGLGSPSDLGHGLDAWLLVDGVTWMPLGIVIEPPNTIHTVSATPRGLVAAGSPDGRSLRLWSSTDASEWSESDLPVAVTGPSFLRSWAHAVGGTDEVTVVFSSTSPDLGLLLRDVLPANLRDEEGNAPLNVGWGGPPWTIDVHGPLGLTVFSVTAEDLGLTEPEIQALLGGGPGATTGWTSIDGNAWTPVELGINYVRDVFEVGGDLIVNGYGSGAETWTSSDGFDWERSALGGGLEYLAPWRDGFVAPRQWGQATDIAYSEDRTTWEPFGLDEYLPDGLSWQFQTVAAGERGLATVITGYAETELSRPVPQNVVIERNGYTLTYDWMGGSIVLASGDGELLRINSHTDQVHDEVAVDFRERSVTFLDPESLEPLVVFTFDELEQAEADAFGGESFSFDQEQVVAFTADGSTWSIENVSETFGDGAFIHLLSVTRNQVVAVVAEYEERFSSIPTPPNVVIWSAVIP